ncbi:MAG: type II-A CRISPR-associated protein Csn2 [Clostridia bacterium]|nr:type II-A CRISPR-associated protein Csn2 [Clostridia bacterium]
MKLAHYLLNDPISWEKININTLVIENSKQYRDFLMELYRQSLGETGNFVLSHDLEIFNIQKSVEFIESIIGVNAENNKKILTAITKELTEIAINDYNAEVMQAYNALNRLISDLIFNSGRDLLFDEINDISQLLKLYNIRPDFDNLSLAEKVLLYMELCEKYLKKTLFVFLNLHSYFSDQELELIFKSFVYKGHKALIIERYDVKASKLENKRIIDKDLCEI